MNSEHEDIGKTAVIKIGTHKGEVCVIKKVDMNAGSHSGWYTVDLRGISLLYTGNELEVNT